jgi:hypothetical protein
MSQERSHRGELHISHPQFSNDGYKRRDEWMRWKGLLTMLGIIIFLAGVVLAFFTFMSYVGGFLYGPFATALQYYNAGAIISAFLIITGGLIMLFSFR